MKTETHKISSNYWTQIKAPENTLAVQVNDGERFLIGKHPDKFFDIELIEYPDTDHISGGYLLYKAIQPLVDKLIGKTEFELVFLIGGDGVMK